MDWYLAVTLLLVGLGAVLLAAEFFLPTGGVLIVAGVFALASAVGVILLYGETWEAFAVTLAVCVGGPIAGWRLVSAYERKMTAGLLRSDAAATAADLPGVAGLERFRGRFGRAVTPLRPAGAVEFDGRRVDAVSEGPMVEAGAGVKCVGVRFGAVVVRPVDAPAGGLDDLSLDSLT